LKDKISLYFLNVIMNNYKRFCSMIRIFTAIITPFDALGEIDYNYLEKLITRQAKAKIDGLVVCGTNGEFPSLSFEEVKALLQFALDKKPGQLEIVAGIGRASLKETIALYKFVEGLADYALVVPPYYFKEIDPAGIYNYFKQLLEETGIPIILYNIPKYTGVEISPQLINKLKNYEKLVGVKDSSGRIETAEEFLSKCPNLSVYAGSDALIYTSFEKGAAGAISSISNIFPQDVLEIKNQFLAGNKAVAKAAQEKVLKIRGILKLFPNRAAVKYALSLMGFSRSSVRPPLSNLTEKQGENLKKQLKSYI
jgi:4-hydroxy-tetrahydrodipicolinate synthase